MSRKKELDFEINLLPIISLLAVLICFLLLSAVWVQFGSQNLKFAYGKSSPSKNASVIQTQIDKGNNIYLSVTNSKDRVLYKRTIRSINKNPNYKRLDRVIKFANKKKNLNAAIISPSEGTKYEDIIKIMDLLKASSITDVGIGTI
ncbi:biopolymer transporter ExbD [bacterium]|nr:biopolymer transporter ExbD [bacterium]